MKPCPICYPYGPGTGMRCDGPPCDGTGKVCEMKCFSIDIETTGLDPNVHGVIEVGAIMFDLFDRLAPTKKFVRYINPENMVWSQYCLDLHRKWLERVNYRIKNNLWSGEAQMDIGDIKIPDGEPKICKNFAEMQIDFFQWLFVDCGFQPPDGNGKWADKITAAGKNFASFDRPFLLKGGFPVRLFHHRAIDPAPLYIRKGDLVPPELKVCKERCPVFDNTAVAHTALEDAQDVITLLHHHFGDVAYMGRND